MSIGKKSDFLAHVNVAALAAGMLLMVSASQANTYYVSNSGSDGNNGTSTATPWQHASKVNTFVFAPGDHIKFARGGVWREYLNPQGGDGAAGNPITFEDYGSGNKPTFLGSDVLNNASFVAGSGIYTYSSATPIGGVYVNHVCLVPANEGAGQMVSSIPNSFWWSGGTLKINVPTNPNSDGKTYTAATRQDIIANGNSLNFTYRNHYVFNNLIADETADPNGGYGVRIMNGTDITLNGVESYRCGKHNFGFIDATQVIANNCYGAYPMGNQSQWGGYTAYVSYGDTAGPNIPNQSSEYHNCTGDHMQDPYVNGPYLNTGYEFFTTHGSNVGSILLDHCQALSSDWGGAGAHWTINNSESAQAGHAATITVNGGYLQNNQFFMQGGGMVVDGLHISGSGASTTNDATGSIDMECSNCTIQNLLMDKIHVGSWLQGAGIYNNGNNNTIRFSTLVNDASSNGPLVKNTGGSLIYDGNITVYGAGVGLTGNTPTENLNNLTYAASSSAGFTNAGAGDYSLTSGSPAKDEVPTSVGHPSTDLNGGARPTGPACDAGAYEFGSGGAPSPPVVTSSGTASGTVGTAFSYQITATNSPTSYGASGIPAGTSVNTGTGLISGTPTTATTYSATVSATNAGGTGSKAVTITIAAGGAVPFVTSSGVAGQSTGVAFLYPITATNSPTSFGASNLPTGLSVNTSNGQITGSVASAGTTTATVSATNASGTGSKSVVITITSSVAESPFGGTAWPIPGTVQAEAFDNGGEGVAYHDSDSTNQGGLYRTDVGVDINSCSDTGGGYEIGFVSNTEYLKYMVNVTTAGSYNLNVRVVTGVSSASTFHFEVDGTNVTGPIAVPNNGWGNYQTITHPGVNFTAGAHTVRLYYEGPNFNVNWWSVTNNAAAPWISSPAAAGDTVNVPFTYQETATNSPTSFGAQGLPAGLSMNASGLISGTPTAVGTTGVVLSATNAGGTDTLLLTITISAAVAESPYGGTAWSVPGTIQLENYDLGGEGVAFHDTDSTNIGATYRNDGVDVATCPDTGGGYQVGWVSSGEWLRYTVNCTSGGAHTASVRVSTGAFSSQTCHIEVDGTNVTGAMAVPNTGWGVFATVTSPSFNITAGSHIVRFVFDAANVNANWLSIN